MPKVDRANSFDKTVGTIVGFIQFFYRTRNSVTKLRDAKVLTFIVKSAQHFDLLFRNFKFNFSKLKTLTIQELH